MKMTLRRGRLALAAAFAALLLCVTGTMTTASAATTYWTFKNHANGKCLTASSSNKVWVATCTGGTSQQWDFVGPNNDWLKNRATGRCMTTDMETHRNAVWTTTCSATYSPARWQYYSNSVFTYPYGDNLRTSPSGSSAVYSVDAWDDAPLEYSEWTGSHN
ncbi:ricin-type beta-trefoil lectin domain protein [Streptomyces sp. RFCAC02]|uniref:ricin-type beta-trefoil lectin domain protein n=1 Tax=Streptomyces sp. RFCAC02 TaxID=2499143 RepID=UPI0010222551|nr:ricin-type beta-trefoil lectin domain protein [Streptomyces sp. RFCAC02]